MITQLVRKQIRAMKEIRWGDIPDTSDMRLLWGENQIPLSVYKRAIEEEIEKINLYPSPTKQKLKEALAKYNGVGKEAIIPTNGSDDALELIAKVFLAEQDEVIVPLPSYPCFASVSQMMGATVRTVLLEPNFSLDVDQMLKTVTPKTKIIWIANPNNPTGNILLTTDQIEEIAKQINCLFVVDECYFELAGVTGASLVKTYPNLVIVRSFSKVFALAGVRLGYIICSEEAALYLNRLQQTNLVFNVNRFAQAAGCAILKEPRLLKQSIAEFQSLKANFEALLAKIPEVQILPTNTTFCLVNILSQTSAGELKKRLERKNIFVKDCSIYEGLGTQYMYVGVPQKAFQQTVVTEIQKALNGG